MDKADTVDASVQYTLAHVPRMFGVQHKRV